MPSSGPYVDPRAAEILCEVIRDPNAKLLRMKNARTFAPTVAGGGAELLMPACGQSAAEKELLRLYREETAYLLRLAYHERALMPRKEKEKGLLIFPETTGGSQQGLGGIEVRLENLRAWWRGELEPSVDLAVSVIRDSTASMFDVACLSARFAPNAAAVGYIVEEYLLNDEAGSAVLACRRALSSSMSTSMRSNLVSKLSVAYSMTGDNVAALESQRRDVLENTPLETGCLNWALYSLLTESESQSREAFEFIDQNWGARTSNSEAWIDCVRAQEDFLGVSRGRRFSSIVKRLLKITGEVSADLLHLTLGHAPTLNR